MSKLTKIGFVAICVLQLAIPARMIFDREFLLSSGKPYKFLVRPMDPVDYIKGSYLDLSFSEDSFNLPNDDTWHYNDAVFIHLAMDSAGFARVTDISRQAPPDNGNTDYVAAKISFVYDDHVTIKYPFDRFYMPEEKAQQADKNFQSLRIDSTKKVYALVKIWKGEAVLKNVFVNAVPLSDISSEKK